jgi:hypothetical protein
MKVWKLLAVSILLTTLSFGMTGAQLATQLHISPSSKAMIQWEGVFKSKRKMRRLGVNSLSEDEKATLKKYLIDHAADSPEPIAAGM